MIKEDFKSFMKSQCVLMISAVLAVATSFFSTPRWECIDCRVLILLFNLMTVVAALNKFKVLDKAAVALLHKCTTYRKANFALTFITFLSAMFVTNDVALLTFVPFTMIVGRKSNMNVLKIVVFQTLAANLGSAFTPMGNPQNLFIYSYYNMVPLEFLKTTLPMVLLGAIFLCILMFKEKNHQLNFEVQEIVLKDKFKISIILSLFLIIILSVFNVVNYKSALALTLAVIFTIDKKLFAKVDYSLLLTFVCFFIFIGNMSSMPMVRTFMESMLNSGANTYFAGILSSQVISNVPATMLISGFTKCSKELLLAVNIGGLGTLIASLASVISYKLYVKEHEEESSKYLSVFTAYNLLGLAVLVPAIYFLMIQTRTVL